jgi:hypothetical protein
MTIPCGGFAVLSTAWMVLVLCGIVGAVLVKKLGRH